MFLTKFTTPAKETLLTEQELLDLASEDKENTQSPELDYFEEDMLFDDDGDGLEGLESLGSEIEHLENLATAIETYGISPALMYVADREGLLSSTFISIPATESMMQPYRPGSSTSTAALEGVMDAIKSKTAEWAARAGGMIKGLLSKSMDVIKNATSWVADFSKHIASKTWDAAKATGRTIKAHPYKTVLVVIASVAAVATVLSLCGAIPQTSAAFGAWISRLRTGLAAIKSPFGSITIESTKGRLKAIFVKPVIHSLEYVQGNLVKLGYGTLDTIKTALSSLKTSLSKLATGAIPTLRTGLYKLIDLREKGAEFARRGSIDIAIKGGATASEVRTAGMYGYYAGRFGTSGLIVGAIMLALKISWLLIKNIVIGGYNLVKTTVMAVGRAAFGGNSEELED